MSIVVIIIVAILFVFALSCFIAAMNKGKHSEQSSNENAILAIEKEIQKLNAQLSAGEISMEEYKKLKLEIIKNI